MAMEAVGAPQPLDQQQQPAAPPVRPVERLNSAVVQQLNLESVKTRAQGLFNAITRILEEFNLIARTNTNPKWQDVLGQFSMVNLELFNIVEDIKKVSKAFVVYPKNVNAETATILPVMLSSKLLPEMEVEDNTKREQLLHGMQNLHIPTQIEKLKARIEMISAACETAEKVIADARKAHGLSSRQGMIAMPTVDKLHAAKIQEQENLLRSAVNFGEGLRLPGDQRHISSLPVHLAEVLTHGEGSHLKNVPPSFSHVNANVSGNVMQVPGSQLTGRPVPSPSAMTGTPSLESASTPPHPYANSPRSGTNMMNTASPQQQQAQQHRQKLMQLNAQQQQQLLAQQHLRQSSATGVLGQNSMQQLSDLQGQNQPKFQAVPGQHQMQYSQSLGQQQFQNRQLQTAQMQQNIVQNQINQGNQLRGHIGQFTGANNNAMFNATQTPQNSQMMSNMASIQSQSTLQRMQQQLGVAGAQRSYPSQMLSDPMYNMGTSNTTNMVQQQQQQQVGVQGVPGNMPNAQNLQVQGGMVGIQNTMQNPSYAQQRQQQNPQ